MVMTLRQALQYAERLLSSISDEPKNEARLAVAQIAGISLGELHISSKTVDSSKIDDVFNRRKMGEPLQYIFGKWWFYKSEFFVGPGVLIPRQDTELLVETGLELIKNIKAPAVADLCSGSGCIAISIAAERTDAQVSAIEKYDEAVCYLNKNIQHNYTDNVTSVTADVLEKPFGSYDLILCNPPYIPLSEKSELSREVLNEPHTALFGGDDGLCFYRSVSQNWKSTLKGGGYLAFEVGIKEADAVCEILKANGYRNIGKKNDLLGIERVVYGTPCII